MPSHGKEVPLLKRVAILTLHWYGDKNWAEISALLKVHPETARVICSQAKERATNPSDFDDVLQYLEDLERPSKHKSQQKDQHKDKLPAEIKSIARIPGERQAAAVSSLGFMRLGALEQQDKHERQQRKDKHERQQRKDKHEVYCQSTIKHKSSKSTYTSIESKELEILEEDLSLVGNSLVGCHGSLEGVTMMRDMDWR